MALKYCGGCDPAYDRVAYWEEIKDIAGGRIEWVSPDNGPYQTILVITGCNTACPERDLGKVGDSSRVIVKSNDLEPQRIVELLLS